MYIGRSEEDVYTVIQKLISQNFTFRRIAAIYGKPITYGDIYRIFKYKKFPLGEEKREALGLVLICPFCKRPLSAFGETSVNNEN